MHYGYLAIFILVFLQETGMPNPFPNELLLLFSGYLSFKGLLSLPLVIFTAATADLIGTNILYFLFYFTGTMIIRKKPRWIPLSEKFIIKLTTKIRKGGYRSIFIFRLTPFTRGYASVITGLLQIAPRVFLPIALMSALTWASFYIILGHFLGPSWSFIAKNIDEIKYILPGILLIVVLVSVLTFLSRRSKENKRENSADET